MNVIDMHICPGKDPEIDVIPSLEECRKAGYTGVVLNAADSRQSLANTVRTISSWRNQIAAYPDRYRQVEQPSDFEDAERDGFLAVAFDIEGAFSVGDRIDLLDTFLTLGVRWMSLAYNLRNLAGGGCHDEPDEGITDVGRALVARMDRIGMIKCCSHTGYRTVLEMLEISTRPTIFSHSNPRNLVDHPRNIPDELMRACAAGGGVVGINGIAWFLGVKDPQASDLFRHVDYAVNLIGAEHVGLGLDYCFTGSSATLTVEDRKEIWPARWYPGGEIIVTPPSMMSPLRSEMEAAGYPQAAIEGIFGRNFLRVANAVWDGRDPQPSRAGGAGIALDGGLVSR